MNLATTIEELPIDAVLWCPRCFEQHIDEAKPEVCEKCGCAKSEHNQEIGICGTGNDCDCSCFKAWLNPPHKSHRCNFCNHVWRPADGPTNGVLSLAKQGERDGSAKPVAFANGKDFDDAVEIANKRLVATLRKCETAIDSLPPDALGIGGKPDSTRWYLRDELLSEIREVLGGN